MNDIDLNDLDWDALAAAADEALTEITDIVLAYGTQANVALEEGALPLVLQLENASFEEELRFPMTTSGARQLADALIRLADKADKLSAGKKDTSRDHLVTAKKDHRTNNGVITLCGTPITWTTPPPAGSPVCKRCEELDG